MYVEEGSVDQGWLVWVAEYWLEESEMGVWHAKEVTSLEEVISYTAACSGTERSGVHSGVVEGHHSSGTEHAGQ